MQVKFGEPNTMNSEETISIAPDLIAGYIIQRSPTSHFLFNVYAVDSDGDYIFCAASDLDFEKATSLVDAINQEYYPVVPTPTEVVELELVGQNRIFKVAKE